MQTLAPVLAVMLTMGLAVIIFGAMGYDGPRAAWDLFLRPLFEPHRWADLALKAAPLVLIAVGLSIGFRANIWNIGAEGQYVAGAIAATGVALITWEMEGVWILPLMCMAGVLGGVAWAALPAFLRVRLGINEILTSLMLTYAAVQLLYWLVRGPWKDPMGFNFPQTRMFSDSQILPMLAEGSNLHLGIIVALLVAIGGWILLTRTSLGLGIRLSGQAPRAADFAGYDAGGLTWFCLLLSGGLAGLAGTFEVSGPFQQLTPGFPVGYGFTAIIVAFLGRLHPLGIILAALVLAVSYVGGEIAQTSLSLPNAAVGLFQALMLFLLLAVDVLVRFRLRIR